MKREECVQRSSVVGCMHMPPTCQCVQEAVERGQDMASEVREGAQGLRQGEVSLNEATNKIQDTAKDVYKAAQGKSQE